MSKRDELSHAIDSWFATLNAKDVAFDRHAGTEDGDSRYQVAVEATFCPKRVDKARIEVWVTDDGDVAVGVEDWKRVAQRLGAASNQDRFAGGHEPCPIEAKALLSLLNAVAGGQVGVKAMTVPVLGLVATKVVATKEVVSNLTANGYTNVDWIKTVSPAEFAREGVLKYQSWR